jgi:hypothetical protein
VRIGSDRLYEYPVDPGDFWVAASRTDLYQSWWPWLERFEAGALADGQVWTCSVRPPLPYTVSFSLELHDVCPGARVQARASGDIEGDARIDIEPADSGCRVRLRSQLSPSSLFLKTAAVVARPLVGLGHSWVLDTGARQFRTRAFAD